jgi:hypothetical protein
VIVSAVMMSPSFVPIKSTPKLVIDDGIDRPYMS